MADTTLKALPKINGFSLQQPRLFPVLGFIALLLLVSLFFVWSRVQVIGLEYEISNLESQLRDAKHETSRLRIEAASLSSPERIERVARKELGLRFPVPDQVIMVD
ncbi:MAG: cell division protein FtsL [Deltaproteobacteria bacterium]|jgi:cell division protein FtsL|nr:cell division protein FtsL [Deltaproteobacteria bacterium]MBW2505357.1 cell division protein FtsL [Deltaproteobacteria bacterium]